MYRLKCGRVTETENIAAALSKNGTLMRRGQCVTCRNLRLNSSKEILPVEAFLLVW